MATTLTLSQAGSLRMAATLDAWRGSPWARMRARQLQENPSEISAEPTRAPIDEHHTRAADGDIAAAWLAAALAGSVLLAIVAG